MIPLRYHVVSLAGFFLALAVGVVLGSTSLSERLLASVSDERAAVQEEAEGLREENRVLRTELSGADRFARAVGTLAVSGRLDGRTVVLISAEGVAEPERAAMRNVLERAGAKVTGEVRLTEGVTDPAQADRLRRVVTGVLPAGVQLPATAQPGTLMGGLLGPLTLSAPQSSVPQVSPQERASAVGGLAEGGFAHVNDSAEPAQLAVILAGARAGGNDAEATSVPLVHLAAQLDGAGSGAVLAGDAGSAAGNGVIGLARTDPATAHDLSTVDNSNTAFGRVAVVLALAEQWERRAGHYGIAGNAQDVVPGARD